MPLQKFFAAQKKQIEAFLGDPHRTMLRLAVDPEAEAMVVKLLGAVDGSPRNSDVFIGCDHTFDERRSFYQKTMARLAEEFKKVQSKLETKNIRTSVADELRGPEDEIESQFARETSRFRNDISNYSAHLVFVFGVPETARQIPYRASLALLLDALSETGVKIIALDRRTEPLLLELATEREDVAILDFNLSPEVIEKGVKDKLAEPSLAPLLRMRCLSVMAGFAMARKEFETALKLGQEVLSQFQKEGNPQEEAAAAFNLGNTYYRKEDWELARQHYERAVSLAIDHKMHNLAEQCLINVGNTWFAVGETANALAYFQGALRWSKAINNQFGVSQCLELVGLAQQRDGQPEAARQTWEEALAVYRGMPPELSQMASAGEAQVLNRLKSLGPAAQQTPPAGNVCGCADPQAGGQHIGKPVP